MSKQMEMKMII